MSAEDWRVRRLPNKWRSLLLELSGHNFPNDQRSLLRAWRIPFREIGLHAGNLGVKDDNILPLLHKQRRVTFFTQDEDFFCCDFCHSAYCLVWLAARADDAAYFVRRFLRHPRFDTVSSRMGFVVRLSHKQIHFWRLTVNVAQSAPWQMK